MSGLLLTLGIALVVASGAEPARAVPLDDLTAYLPAAMDLRDWAPSGSPQHYVGEDLYTYIDGGAEIYQEYGFKQVLAQDYRNSAGRSVTLELYEMNTPEAAFGMYTFKAGSKGQAVKIGQTAELDDYYLNAWKGRIVLTVIGFDESAESLAGVQAVAEAAAAKIPAAGSRPELLNRLPEIWRRSPHIKYFVGILGIFNIDDFFRDDIFHFKAGAASEIDGEWLFLFQYAGRAECLSRLGEVQKTLASKASLKRFGTTTDGGFEGQTAKGKTLRGKAAGELIVLAMTGKGATAAERILAAFDR